VKLFAAAVATLFAAAVPSPPSEVDARVVTSCADVPRLAAPTVMDFEAAPAVYVLPESNLPEPGVEWVNGGIQRTYADLGTTAPVLCPGSDTEYYQVRTFQRVASSAMPRCWKYVTETERTGDCAAVPSLYDPSPDDAPAPPIDPDFDEYSPTGPIDGPGEGPGQGTPADKP
jgi:hypothetical protein